MDPTTDQTATHIRAIDLVTEQFRRSGTIFPVNIDKNCGTGGYSLSSATTDCENGMRTLVLRVPRRLTSLHAVASDDFGRLSYTDLEPLPTGDSISL
jgi:hypothetical protein